MSELSTPTALLSRDSGEQYLVANGLRLCYQEFGNPEDPAIVLIMGLGTQMVAWPDAFCHGLAQKGFRVVRFDNRDIGLSEKIKTDVGISIPRLILQARFGVPVKVPYTLNDMAADTVGVLDALQIEQAHIVGASMGGMISQLVAIHYPERCLSLTSIMSTTGNRSLPAASLKVNRLLAGRPTTGGVEAAVAYGLKVWAVIGSPDFPPNPDELRARLRFTFERSSYPKGYRNQMAAIVHNGDRRSLLQKVEVPTLVIHGKQDVLVPMAGGVDTAKHIRNAKLELIEGMGHDLPKQLVPRMVRMIERHIKAEDQI